MKSKYHSLKKIVLATLAFGALAQPAWAAPPISINSCREIKAPGSYKLTKDLDGQRLPSDDVCFRIKASNVTLDLGGHTVRGSSLEASYNYAVLGAGTAVGIKIRNGTLVDWGVAGVYLPDAFGTVIEYLKVIGNGKNGLVVGAGAQIQQVKAIQNGEDGIVAGHGAFVNGVAIESSGGHGLVVGVGSLVLNVSSYFNGKHGIFLDHALVGNTGIKANTTGANGGVGIWVDCTGDIGAISASSVTVTGNYRDPAFPNTGPDIVASVPEIIYGPEVHPELCKELQPGTVLHRDRYHPLPRHQDPHIGIHILDEVQK